MTEQERLEQAEKQIEISIDTAKSVVKRKEAVDRLFDNKDFKFIFEEGYFKEEPARLVSLLTDPEFASDERQEEIQRDMIGISALRQYLMNLLRLGYQMEQQIARSEQELEELRNEVEGE
jgi:hypothetical protein